MRSAERRAGVYYDTRRPTDETKRDVVETRSRQNRGALLAPPDGAFHARVATTTARNNALRTASLALANDFRIILLNLHEPVGPEKIFLRF